MALPKFLQPCFPSYDLKHLDKTRDKRLIITQILNTGTEKEVRWVGKNYSKKDICEAIFKPEKGMWLKEVLMYWQRILNLKIPKKIFQKAILDLNPHF